jgi:hypothetical protein
MHSTGNNPKPQRRWGRNVLERLVLLLLGFGVSLIAPDDGAAWFALLMPLAGGITLMVAKLLHPSQDGEPVGHELREMVDLFLSAIPMLVLVFGLGQVTHTQSALVIRVLMVPGVWLAARALETVRDNAARPDDTGLW